MVVVPVLVAVGMAATESNLGTETFGSPQPLTRTSYWLLFIVRATFLTVRLAVVVPLYVAFSGKRLKAMSEGVFSYH